ncbi:MAG: hypothetical protein DI536_34540 [Archangium gephyra]|uniref:Lipoprotein n=1 Tax=Archangium gephyra TaxID=48 RepID=A0A2W5SXL1_9BACT|nr:MAG: hypothetical protein DI536_34540 [Archangium gephyra]
MKTLVLAALSFSLVACGGSLEVEVEGAEAQHGEAALREAFLPPPAASETTRKPERVKVVRLTAEAIEALALSASEVVELTPEAIEAVRGAGQQQLADEVAELTPEPVEARVSIGVADAARNSLLIVSSRPVTAETMLAMSGVTKLNLSCRSSSTGVTTSLFAHCTWADGRVLAAAELQALPEVLSFIGSLED